MNNQHTRSDEKLDVPMITGAINASMADVMKDLEAY